MTRALRSVAVCGPVWLAMALHSSVVMAYTTVENWCNRFNCGWLDGCSQSFTDRELADYSAVREDLRIAAAWWSEAQAGFRFSTPVASCYSPFDRRDPGAVQGRCRGEDGLLTDDAARTWLAYYPHPACDTWGVNTDAWNMAIATNLQNDLGCHDPDGNRGWAFNKTESTSAQPLFVTAAHEFGHVIGLGHSQDVYGLMYPWAWSASRLTNDDIDGVRWGLDEGADLRDLKTVKATLSGTTLTFGSVQTTSVHYLSWGPAIAADHPTYDFILAWVNGTNYGISIGLANQDAQGNLGTITQKLIPWEYSKAPVGVAIGPSGRIGVAWAGIDQPNTVNFAVSTDDGDTWTKTTFDGWYALGGVAVTYNDYQARWVISWVADRPLDPFTRDIVIMTSDDSSGESWWGIAYYYGDFLSMPYGRPALACAHNTVGGVSDKCMMLFKTYGTNLKPTQSIPFQMAWNSTYQDYQLSYLAYPQDFSGGTTYMTTNLFHVSPQNPRQYGKYIALEVPFVLSPGKLTYAVKPEDELNSGNYGFPAAQQWTNGPTTRSGFAGAHSRRKNVVRLVWKDE